MAASLTASPAEPHGWIRSTEDRAFPSRFYVETEVDGYKVTMLAEVGHRGPGATHVAVRQPAGRDGAPVTMTVLRRIAVDHVIREAIDQLSRPAVTDESEPGAFRVEGIDGLWHGPALQVSGRGSQTEDARLTRVASLYLDALAAGKPPVRAVADQLPSSRSTAGRLVGQARKAGLLTPTTRGRRGTLADLARLAQQLEHAGGEVVITEVPRPDTERQPVVAAIVTSRRGVLAGRRNDATPPWTFIAGEVEPGEDPRDAAIREVKEETGLEIRVGAVIGERDHPATGRHMIYLVARPVRGATKVIVGDEAELAEVRWLSLAEADELLTGMFGPVREHLAHELKSTNR